MAASKSLRDYQRYARRGTTTARGLGYRDHVAIGRQLFAQWKPGDPCARCGQPMWSRWTSGRNGKRVSAIDVDDFPGRAYGGPQVKRLSHRSCNRRAGARMGNLARSRRSGWRQSREW